MYFRLVINSSAGVLGGSDQDAGMAETCRMLNLATVHLANGQVEGVCCIQDGGVRAGSWTTIRPYDHATMQVSIWIESDREHYLGAREHAEAGDHAFLAMHLLGIILAAREGDAAWHVKEALSQAELAAVNWAAVAQGLSGD